MVDFLNKNISCFTDGIFPNDFKNAVVHQPIKKIVKLKNLSVYQLASYRISQSLWNCLILPNVYALQ